MFSGPQLLELPPHLRLRVYAASSILNGNTSPCFINLNNQGAPSDYLASRTSFVTTHSLLLTCRTIYSEVSAEVYRSNHFFIRLGDTNDLGALRRVLPHSIRALRKLTIHLNVVSCGLGQPCDRKLDPWWSPGYDRRDEPLSLNDMAAQDALFSWHDTWYEHIKPNLATPCHLELSFVCDVSDAQTGELAVEPFLEDNRPCIARCSVRLNHKKDPVLQQLAGRAVAAMTTLKQTALDQSLAMKIGTFPFLKLPAELRQHILQYTDLVTEWNEVEWNPDQGFFSRTNVHTYEDYFPQNAHGMHDVPYVSPWRGPQTSCRTASWNDSGHRGCFCTTWHTAASTSDFCRCWAPPTPLFLVCHTMRDDAQQVFFSRNRFVIGPSVSGDHTQSADAPDLRLSISVFLTETVPVEALRHLRFIEVIFMSYRAAPSRTYCARDSPEWKDWVHTVLKVRSHLTLGQLTISLKFLQSHYNRYSIGFIRDQSLETYKKNMFDTMLPLHLLRGMHRLFAHLNTNVIRSWDPLEIEDWSEYVEKKIMGDAYDSSAMGKGIQERSLWERDSDRWPDKLAPPLPEEPPEFADGIGY